MSIRVATIARASRRWVRPSLSFCPLSTRHVVASCARDDIATNTDRCCPPVCSSASQFVNGVFPARPARLGFESEGGTERLQYRGILRSTEYLVF